MTEPERSTRPTTLAESTPTGPNPAAPMPTGGSIMPLILGHRGASADRAENTLAAFIEADEQGADGVELDVRLTADQLLVLSHDRALGDGTLIHRTSAAALRKLAPLENLPAALEVAPGIVNVEVKSDEAAEQAVASLRELHESGMSFTGGQPFSDYFTVEDAVADGEVVLVTLRPVKGAQTGMLFDAINSREILFISR